MYEGTSCFLLKFFFFPSVVDFLQRTHLNNLRLLDSEMGQRLSLHHALHKRRRQLRHGSQKAIRVHRVVQQRCIEGEALCASGGRVHAQHVRAHDVVQLLLWNARNLAAVENVLDQSRLQLKTGSVSDSRADT